MSIELLLKVNIIINWAVKASISVENYLYHFFSFTREFSGNQRCLIFWKYKTRNMIWFGYMKLVLVFNKLRFFYICIFTLLPQLSEAVAWSCSVKKVYLEILQNSQENTCARVSFLIKLQVSKKRLWHRYFLLNFAKFWRTPFIAKHLGWLLLSFRIFD